VIRATITAAEAFRLTTEAVDFDVLVGDAWYPVVDATAFGDTGASFELGAPKPDGLVHLDTAWQTILEVRS